MIINIKELDLPPSLVEIVELLNENHTNYVNTLDFLNHGILSSAAGIAKLKEKGVLFETKYVSVINGSGRSRKRIAHYKIEGKV